MHVAHNTLAKGHVSCIFGHTHKIQKFEHNDLLGESLVGINGGWLGDPNSDVFGYMEHVPQWQHGFVVITAFDDGTWFDSIIEIKKGRAIANGAVYESKCRQLNKKLPPLPVEYA